MNELLQAIKADLASRRLLPLVVALCVALVAALAYVALGGKEQAEPPRTVAAAPVPSGLPVTIAPPNATAAAAETPGGSRYQTHSPSRDPFQAPVTSASPGGSVSNTAPASKNAGSGNVSNTSKSVGIPSTGGSSGESGSPSNRPKATPAPPAKKKTSKRPLDFKPRPDPLYGVSVLFGLAPASPQQQPTLTPFEELLLYEPLPSAKTPVIVYIGVTKTAQKAVFALVAPPILRGPATCLPSQSQCQAIGLAAGQSEELEYVKRNGEAVDFELQVVKVSPRSGVSGASAKARRVSRAGRRALSRAGLLSVG